MAKFDHEQVTRLLEEMEQCVNRVKALCEGLKSSWKNEEDFGF